MGASQSTQSHVNNRNIKKDIEELFKISYDNTTQRHFTPIDQNQLSTSSINVDTIIEQLSMKGGANFTLNPNNIPDRMRFKNIDGGGKIGIGAAASGSGDVVGVSEKGTSEPNKDITTAISQPSGKGEDDPNKHIKSITNALGDDIIEDISPELELFATESWISSEKSKTPNEDNPTVLDDNILYDILEDITSVLSFRDTEESTTVPNKDITTVLGDDIVEDITSVLGENVIKNINDVLKIDDMMKDIIYIIYIIKKISGNAVKFTNNIIKIANTYVDGKFYIKDFNNNILELYDFLSKIHIARFEIKFYKLIHFEIMKILNNILKNKDLDKILEYFNSKEELISLKYEFIEKKRLLDAIMKMNTKILELIKLEDEKTLQTYKTAIRYIKKFNEYAKPQFREYFSGKELYEKELSEKYYYNRYNHDKGYYNEHSSGKRFSDEDIYNGNIPDGEDIYYGNIVDDDIYNKNIYEYEPLTLYGTFNGDYIDMDYVDYLKKNIEIYGNTEKIKFLKNYDKFLDNEIYGTTSLGIPFLIRLKTEFDDVLVKLMYIKNIKEYVSISNGGEDNVKKINNIYTDLNEKYKEIKELYKAVESVARRNVLIKSRYIKREDHKKRREFGKIKDIDRTKDIDGTKDIDEIIEDIKVIAIKVKNIYGYAIKQENKISDIRNIIHDINTKDDKYMIIEIYGNIKEANDILSNVLCAKNEIFLLKLKAVKMEEELLEIPEVINEKLREIFFIEDMVLEAVDRSKRIIENIYDIIQPKLKVNDIKYDYYEYPLYSNQKYYDHAIRNAEYYEKVVAMIEEYIIMVFINYISKTETLTRTDEIEFFEVNVMLINSMRNFVIYLFDVYREDFNYMYEYDLDKVKKQVSYAKYEYDEFGNDYDNSYEKAKKEYKYLQQNTYPIVYFNDTEKISKIYNKLEKTYEILTGKLR